MRITVEVSELLGRQLKRVTARLPEIVERGLQHVVAEEPGLLGSSNDQFMRALRNADMLRQQIRHWQHEQGIVTEESLEALRRLRKEHDAFFTRLY